MPATYPLPLDLLAKLAFDALRRRPRSYRRDALAWIARQQPPPRVHGKQFVPASGPCLLTINHYTRPGLGAWWLPFAVSSIVPFEVHWIMTTGWRFENRLLGPLLRPPFHFALEAIARTYGFTGMPPMPPEPAETERRARAVREVLRYGRSAPQPAIGISPEGRDFPGGRLGWPAPGAGRFLLHLAGLGLPLVPVAGYEEDGALTVRFGPAYTLDAARSVRAEDARDEQARRSVMEHIAELLPPELRGEFA